MPSSTVSPPALSGSPTSSQGGRPRGTLVRGAAAVLAATCSYVLVASGSLAGLPAVVLLLAVLLMLPSHPHLAPRLAVNTALVIGWTPVLWWVAWPVPVSHAGIVIGLGVGTMVAAGLRGVALRPQMVLSELLILTAASMMAAAAVSKWALSRTPSNALQQLVPGVDNSVHYGMFLSLRTYGAVPEALGPTPDGSSWAYGNYPKGFETVVATLTETFAPRLEGGAEALPVYLHGEAVVVVLGVLLAAAAMLSLPGLRTRPVVAVPSIALMCSALLWEPGQKVFADGFTAFWLGAVAAGAALLIGSGRSRPALVDVAAVSGLILLVSHCWLPLVVLAAPAGLIVLGRCLTAGLSRSKRSMALLILAAGALGSMKSVVLVLSAVSVTQLVEADGGYHAPALPPVLGLLLLGSYALLARSPRDADGGQRVPKWQRLLLLLTPAVGFLMLAAMAVVQVRRHGATAYYFAKLLLGYEIVLAVLAPAAAGMLAALVLVPVGRQLTRIAISVLLTSAAAVAFGVMSPNKAMLFNDSEVGTASLSPPYTRAGLADGVLAASGTTSEVDSFETVYVALGSGNAGLLFYPDLWFHAVQASLSAKGQLRLETMRLEVSTPEAAAPVISTMLEQDPDLIVVVPHRYVAAVRDGLDPRWAPSVVPIFPLKGR